MVQYGKLPNKTIGDFLKQDLMNNLYIESSVILVYLRPKTRNAKCQRDRRLSLIRNTIHSAFGY